MPQLDSEALAELTELFVSMIPSNMLMHKGMAKGFIEREVRKADHKEIKNDMLEILFWIGHRILPKLDPDEIKEKEKEIKEFHETISKVYLAAD